jgi:hypothetical protein
MLDEDLGVPLDRLEHSGPDGLGKSPDDGVVVTEKSLGAFIVVTEAEHRWAKVVEEATALVDVVHVVIGCVLRCGVGKRSCPKRCKVVSVPEMDDLGGLESVAESEDGLECLLVGPRPVGAADGHDTPPATGDVHAACGSETATLYKMF